MNSHGFYTFNGELDHFADRWSDSVGSLTQIRSFVISINRLQQKRPILQQSSPISLDRSIIPWGVRNRFFPLDDGLRCSIGGAGQAEVRFLQGKRVFWLLQPVRGNWRRKEKTNKNRNFCSSPNNENMTFNLQMLKMEKHIRSIHWLIDWLIDPLIDWFIYWDVRKTASGNSQECNEAWQLAQDHHNESYTARGQFGEPMRAPVQSGSPILSRAGWFSQSEISAVTGQRMGHRAWLGSLTSESLHWKSDIIMRKITDFFPLILEIQKINEGEQNVLMR